MLIALDCFVSGINTKNLQLTSDERMIVEAAITSRYASQVERLRARLLELVLCRQRIAA